MNFLKDLILGFVGILFLVFSGVFVVKLVYYSMSFGWIGALVFFSFLGGLILAIQNN